MQSTTLFHLLTPMTFFSLSPRGRPCPSSPLLPIQGHILGNTCARHVFFDLLVSCLLAASSSSGTWYCQVHHSAVDVFRISFLDMSKPTKTATADNLVDRRKVYYASNVFVSHVIPSRVYILYMYYTFHLRSKQPILRVNLIVISGVRKRYG